MNNTGAVWFSLLTLFALSVMANADVAPPIITVNVTYNGGPVNATFYSTMLFTCTNSPNVSTSGIQVPQLRTSYYDAARGCYWTHDNLARDAVCTNGMCRFRFFPQSNFKMAFYLPSLNKIFVTNEVSISNFTTSFSAQLHPNGSATIARVSSPILAPGILGFFSAALALTLVIEVAAAFLYLRAVKTKKKGRILGAVVLVNIISVPVLWFGFVYFLGTLGFVLGEIFAVVFEGYAVYYLNRKAIKLRRAMLMSLLMNLASLTIGAFVVVLLGG